MRSCRPTWSRRTQWGQCVHGNLHGTLALDRCAGAPTVPVISSKLRAGVASHLVEVEE